MSTPEALKPCPWCSAPAFLYGNDSSVEVRAKHHELCPFVGHFGKPSEVRSTWNRRAGEPGVPGTALPTDKQVERQIRFYLHGGHDASEFGEATQRHVREAAAHALKLVRDAEAKLRGSAVPHDTGAVPEATTKEG